MMDGKIETQIDAMIETDIDYQLHERNVEPEQIELFEEEAWMRTSFGWGYGD